MTDANIFNQLLIWPILNFLIAFYKVFETIRVPGAFGLAVIVMTVFIRLLLYPLMGSQLKSAKKMQDLKPRLDELSKKYGKDKGRLQQEQMRLYKEAGVNPAAGCLPLLLQMLVFIALYNVFWQILGNGNLGKVVEEINQIVYFPILKIQGIDLSFFGANLGIKPSAWQTDGVWLLMIPVVTALLQWYQTKLMTVKTQTSSTLPKASGEKEEDMTKIMQGQMSFLFPLMIGWFAFSFPVGLSLYWNTFSVLGIIQQLQINKGK